MFDYLRNIIMNKHVKSTRYRLPALIVAASLTLVSTQSQAAPGLLSQVPLFLAQGVQPNILLLMDNSGSMDEEVLLRKGAIGLYPLKGGGHYLAFDASKTKTSYAHIHLNLSHCAGFNVLAYDPKVTYEPWYGLDTNKNPFVDQKVVSAAVNPYTGTGGGDGCIGYGVDNTNGNTCNLKTGFSTGEGAFYYVWRDRNENGLYDKGECSSDAHKSDDYNAADRVYLKDLDSAAQTNYANWFSYYRTRDYVMKRAVSQIIDESSSRLGLAVINNSYFNSHLTHYPRKPVGTPIKNVDDLTAPVNTTAKNNKATLMDNLLGIRPYGWTPLRLSLQRAGAYFRGKDNGNLFAFWAPDDPDSASGHSPILKETLGGTCQQNFVVLLSDGYWNGDDPYIGNVDRDDVDNPFDGQSYADTASNTLADVAMDLYKGDLLTTLDNKVPAVAIPRGSDPDVKCYDASGKKTQECFDTNSAQHLVTFTVSFGVTGTIPMYDANGNDCLPGNRTDSVATQGWPSSCDETISDGWPIPVGDDATTTDDMKHAAWNGRGRYLSAENPADLISKLNQAIAEINVRKPVSATAVEVSAFNVINGGVIFQGKFDSTAWSGELAARDFTGGVLGDQKWAAHTLLDSMDINERILVTYNGSEGVPFTFPDNYKSLTGNDISQAQVNDLLYNAPYASDTSNDNEIAERTAYGKSLVKYLRGDHSNEGTSLKKFRARHGHRLGDIIHSSPVYVGNPDPDRYPDNIAAVAYSNWANNPTTASPNPGAYNRQEIVYVGANDGALHAFNGSTGAEVFAYYPKAIFSSEEGYGLHWLASPFYEHRYYVDNAPAVGEIYADTGDADGLTWRTVLVGGLRGGGRAIYAIDVSDPSEFTDASGVAGNILWEFTHPDLGYTYGKPTIVKLNDGRWAAIFGNGYNPTGATATGEAALFIKYLDNKAPSYRVIYTDVGSIANGDCQDAGSSCNGLATPAVVDLGADRVADRVYAGDLQGNLWAFDLSSTNASNWKSAYGTLANPEPLFTAYTFASDGSTKLPQPITSRPIVTLHPSMRQGATQPNTMIFFGTGQYLLKNDLINKGVNSFYGIWDSGSPISFDRTATDPQLVKQVITKTTLADKEVRTLSNSPVNYSKDKGWFVDLPDSGERVVVSPIIYGNLVIYTTMAPFNNLCNESAGFSWLMVHNLANGSEPHYTVLDITGDGVYNGSDQIDGSNVAGVKSDTIYWQPSMVKTDNGMNTLLLPTDNADSDGGIDKQEMPIEAFTSTRSSWGNLRPEDG